MAAMLCVALWAPAGCGGLPEREIGFRSADPEGRIEALRRAADRGDRSAIPDLIALLDADESGQRMLAQQALLRMVGTDFGYDYAAPEPERRAASRRWRDWWRSQPPEGPAAPPPGARLANRPG